MSVSRATASAPSATATIALGIALFTLAAEPLVRLFLAEGFVPAIPVIRTYMVGDLLRVWTTLAMFAVFAAGRPERYAGIEMATVTVMALLALALIAQGEPRAPQLAYAAAYGLSALLISLVFLHRRRRRRPLAVPLQRPG